jgi:hypothetical protein
LIPSATPTSVSLLVQISASTEINGLTATQADDAFLNAFSQLTATALSLSKDAVHVNSIEDITRRRLSLLDQGQGQSQQMRGLSSQMKLTFVITTLLGSSGNNGLGFRNGSVAVATYRNLLSSKYSNPVTATELITMALNFGSTSLTSSSVLTLSPPLVDEIFTLIEVKTGAPTIAPSSQNGDSNNDEFPKLIIILVGISIISLGLVASCLICFQKTERKVTRRSSSKLSYGPEE